MKKFIALVSPILLLVPMAVFAQSPDSGAVTSYIDAFQAILNAAVPFVIGLAVIAILIGLAKYAFAAGDEGAQASGRRIMLVGVIVLFVMVALWGFVNILLQFFFSGDTGTIPNTNLLPS